MIFDGETLFKVDATHANPIDTNGAGDLFAGAFLYGITHGHNYEQSANLANRCASRLIARFGARLPRADQQVVLAELDTA